MSLLTSFFLDDAPTADQIKQKISDNRPLALGMFIGFVLITLGITFWASRRNRTASEFYTAGRRINAWQNGVAVSGDYLSAASFLGIAGLIALNGYDGFLYSVGFLVAYLTVLLLVAEPLRNSGKFTVADVLANRLKQKPVRAAAAISTLTISTFYMIAQMIGAGTLIKLLFGWDFEPSVLLVGTLMIVYVVFGGMLATTWVQIIKAILLICGTIILTILLLAKFNFDVGAFFHSVTSVVRTQGGKPVNMLDAGLQYSDTRGSFDLLSLGLALVLGTAGLPHILVRFYTVPSAKEARRSVAWATTIIGGFYILTTFLGFGAVSQVGPVVIRQIDAGGNSAAPVLALQIGGPLFFAFISAIAFATIVAVVAGLTISASSAIAHDVWLNIVKDGKGSEKEQVLVARITALSVGIVAILLAILLKGANTAYMVGLAFAVAASANLPVILFTIFWKKFTTTGAVTGILVGLISAIFLILVGPYGFMSHPTVANGADYSSIFGNIGANGKVLASGSGNVLFNLANPGIISIPLGFLGAWLGSLLSQDKTAEAKYPQVHFRAETGIGAEVAEAEGVLVGSAADA